MKGFKNLRCSGFLKKGEKVTVDVEKTFRLDTFIYEDVSHRIDYRVFPKI